MEQTGYINVTGGRVWYKRVGSDKPGIPLLLLHGGPGGTHLTLQGLTALSDERPVVFYDQLGSGKSDRPTDKSLWTMERFVEELAQVREALRLDRVHILGHSWGTMLLAEYLLTRQPTGVESVIFSSPCHSAPRWAEDQARYKKQLPQELQDIIDRCEAEGTTDSEDYQKAVEEYYRRHVCRLDPPPPIREQAKKESNHEIYLHMWGPAEFSATGTLKSFDCTDRLHEIHVPTLFTCGRYDEATPETVADYCSRVPGAKMVVFENSSHTPYLEEPEAYIAVVREFLRSVESGNQG
jgi:proline iminopeptidase